MVMGRSTTKVSPLSVVMCHLSWEMFVEFVKVEFVHCTNPAISKYVPDDAVKVIPLPSIVHKNVQHVYRGHWLSRRCYIGHSSVAMR